MRLRSTQSRGREVRWLGRRVVSLVPSATEIVAALARVHELVGRSHECDSQILPSLRDRSAADGLDAGDRHITRLPNHRHPHPAASLTA